MNRLCLVLVLLFACASCAAPQAAPPTAQPFAGLPALSGLDGIKAAAEVLADDIPVTLPIDSANATPDLVNNVLNFSAPAGDLAWAIWRVTPPQGQALLALAGGSGALWVLVADYTADHWVGAAEFNPSDASIDLTTLGDLVSPAGFMYLAVVCPVQQSGVLQMLELMYDTDNPYNLRVEPMIVAGKPAGAALSWSSGIAQQYRIYRSTLPHDPAPFWIGTWIDNSQSDNSWVDFVSFDSEDSTWVQHEFQAESDHDAYVMIAPGVRYYYFIVPYNGDTPLQPSPELGFKLDWGALRTTRRPLPETFARTRVLADQLLASSMNPAQIAWCANNLVGTQKIFKKDADLFRATNPDFLVLGYHLGVGAGDIGNVCGDEWDANADWPYVNQHEGWFLHIPGSPQPAERVLQQDWNWNVADPQSDWRTYISTNLLEMLGENHLDGWFIDSCAQPWNTDPAQWWPSSQDMFPYWTPRQNNMLRYINTAAKLHPLKPYIIPNAGAYITTLSDIKYYGSNWACDGIMIEGHAHNAPGDYYTEADWALEHNRILDHQQHSLAAILQTGIDPADTDDRLFVYASYLLVRGTQTYINWLGDDGVGGIDSQAGQWYPEFNTDAELGAPPAPPAATVEAMLTPEGLYKRQLGQGFVLVNASDSDKQYATPWHMLKLTVTGGGNVLADGSTPGSYSWEGINGLQTLPPHTALIILDVLD
jgi:hypothetical protein